MTLTMCTRICKKTVMNMFQDLSVTADSIWLWSKSYEHPITEDCYLQAICAKFPQIFVAKKRAMNCIKDIKRYMVE